MTHADTSPAHHRATGTRPNSETWALVLPYVILLGLPLLIYRDSLFYGLSLDVPRFLQQAILYPALEYFYSPKAYQHISTVNVTPFLTLSFHLDYLLDGVNTGLFRIHQLVSTGILACLVYHLSRRLNASAVIAFACTVLFLLSPSISSVATSLNTRHYIEGSIFVLASLLLFMRYNEQAQTRDLLLSALCFLICSTAKEIFLPLPLILFILARGNLLQKVLAIRFHIIVTVIYLAWRTYLLEQTVGGYAQESVRSVVDYFIALRIFILYSYGLGNNVVLFPLGALLMVVTGYALARKKLNIWLFVASFFCVYLPMIPLTQILVHWLGPSPRWLLLFNLSVSLYIAWGLKHIQHRIIYWPCVLLLLAIIPAQWDRESGNVDKRINNFAQIDPFTEFLWQGHTDKYLYIPLNIRNAMYTDFLVEVAYLRELVFREPATFVAFDPVVRHFYALKGKSYRFTDHLDVPQDPSSARAFVEAPMPIRALEFMPEDLERRSREGIEQHEDNLLWDFSTLIPEQCERLQLFLFNDDKYIIVFLSIKSEYYNIGWRSGYTGIDLDTAQAMLACLKEKAPEHWLYTRPFPAKDLKASIMKES